MPTDLQHTRIDDLVEQNYVRAQVLNYFGIQFYEYSEMTLCEACHSRGLNVDRVVNELESVNQSKEEPPLLSYPVDLIIEYLKHAHFLFVKHKLPYISRLVEDFQTGDPEFVTIAKDLKTLFPLFVEDFIHHIYQEEDTLFHYIQLLERGRLQNKPTSELYFQMERHSLQRFSVEHEVHDDEMVGIRKITSNYRTSNETPLHIRVLYAELTGLEDSLRVHARIENEILFPKAMTIEGQVRDLFREMIKSN